MDVSFVTGKEKFNYRVCALLLHEGKILAMQDERSPYYYLPGGRVQMGETAEQAVARELREELGVAVEIQRPLWAEPGVFSPRRWTASPTMSCASISSWPPWGRSCWTKGKSFVLREGKHTHTFTWLRWESLREEYFYPLFLKEEIFHLPDALTLRTEWE